MAEVEVLQNAYFHLFRREVCGVYFRSTTGRRTAATDDFDEKTVLEKRGKNKRIEFQYTHGGRERKKNEKKRGRGGGTATPILSPPRVWERWREPFFGSVLSLNRSQSKFILGRRTRMMWSWGARPSPRTQKVMKSIPRPSEVSVVVQRPCWGKTSV